MQTREEIEEAIEAQKEVIDEDRHKLRWYTRGFLIFWLGISLCVGSLLIVAIFSNSVVNSIFVTTSVLSGFIAVVAGGVAGFNYLSYLDSYKSKNGSTYEKLRKEK